MSDLLATFCILHISGEQNVHELLTSSLSTHAVEQVLKVVPQDSSQEFYEYYLNDFISNLALQIQDKDNGNEVSNDEVFVNDT